MDGRQILPDMWNWAGSGDSAAEVVHAVDFSQRVQLVVAFSGPPAEAYLCISFLERLACQHPTCGGWMSPPGGMWLLMPRTPGLGSI